MEIQERLQLSIVQADFFVIEIIDDDRFSRLASAVGKIVSQIREIIL